MPSAALFSSSSVLPSAVAADPVRKGLESAGAQRIGLRFFGLLLFDKFLAHRVRLESPI
jgi:hypothetical protein